MQMWVTGLAVIAFSATGLRARAECDLPNPSPASAGWYVVEGENFAFTAVNESIPRLAVPLQTDAPVIPRILDFVVLPRYGGRVALLQYFAGDPGTSTLVTVIRNAVVDLRTGQTLGTPQVSADCHALHWRWFDDHIEIAGQDGAEVIPLPRS